MNKLFFLLLAPVLFFSCRPTPASGPVDKEAAKQQIVSVLDKLHAAEGARDINAYLAMLSDSGLYCGTDPNELWDKADLQKTMSQAMTDTSLTTNLNIDKRVLMVADDCMSALAIEQFFMADMFGPNLPVRSVKHLVKTQNGWIIDFLSWSLIPRNEDIGKLEKALEE